MRGKVRFYCIVLLILSVIGSAHSDDGSWSKSFTVDSGSIYAESENSEIALTKELLVFDGERTLVLLQFENTSDKRSTVVCGFPVRHAIRTFLRDGHLEISVGKYGNSSIPAMRHFQTESLDASSYEEEDLDFLYPEIIPINDFNNRREFIDQEESGSGVSVRIEQDGESIMIDDVLLERHAGPDGAWITYHYRHSLSFPPKQISVVRVEYTQDLFHGQEGMGGDLLLNVEVSCGSGSGCQ